MKLPLALFYLRLAHPETSTNTYCRYASQLPVVASCKVFLGKKKLKLLLKSIKHLLKLVLHHAKYRRLVLYLYISFHSM